MWCVFDSDILWLSLERRVNVENTVNKSNVSQDHNTTCGCCQVGNAILSGSQLLVSFYLFPC
jgi:hypothetical protein